MITDCYNNKNELISDIEKYKEISKTKLTLMISKNYFR